MKQLSKHFTLNHKCQPHVDAREEFGGSPGKSAGFTLWAFTNSCNETRLTLLVLAENGKIVKGRSKTADGSLQPLLSGLASVSREAKWPY